MASCPITEEEDCTPKQTAMFKALAEAAGKREKAFRSATAAKRRVLIAQDVLAAMATNILDGNGAIYLEVDLHRQDDRELRDRMFVHRARKEKGSLCSACALGAMFVGRVMLTNRFKLSDFDPMDRDSVVRDLRHYFSEAQLDLIETAYEDLPCGKLGVMAPIDWEYGLKYPDQFRWWTGGERAAAQACKRASTFASRHRYGEARMRAIMRNIIRNKGTFQP